MAPNEAEATGLKCHIESQLCESFKRNNVFKKVRKLENRNMRQGFVFKFMDTYYVFKF